MYEGKTCVTRRYFFLATACSVSLALLSCAANATTAKAAHDNGTYVALGDSVTAGSHATAPGDRYVARYRNRKSAQLSVNLKLDNRGVGGDTSSDLLNMILNDRGTREAISGARVITVFIGYNDIRMPRLAYRQGTGGGADGQDDYRQALDRFGDNFSRIMYNVARLAGPDADIRTSTVYYPQARGEEDHYVDGSGRSVADVHRSYLAQMNRIIVYSSGQHGAKVAPVYVKFNGMNDYGFRRDPVTQGYISYDGIHPNDLGHQAIANAFAGLN